MQEVLLRSQTSQKSKIREIPFTYDLKKMEKAVHSKRTGVPKMKSFEDFEKWLES